MTELLEKLDKETPSEVCPLTTKAGSAVIETRDTVHPKLVTEMLNGILRAVGQPLDVPRIYKHTRDDVVWENALHPWRRSPEWLFLRVSLQTSLVRHEAEGSHMRYKSFMLFFLAYVLNEGLEAALPSDTLFTMTAKISRRALKLGRAADRHSWLKYVETVMKAVQQELTRRWDLLEKNPDPLATQQHWSPSQLSFLSDTQLTLPKLKMYLPRAMARLAIAPSSNQFKSDYRHRILPYDINLPNLSLFLELNGSQTRLNLADLESWVSNNLENWLRTNLEHEDACAALKKLIDTYTSAASSTYADIPEDISIMLLTTMDLWIAIDRCALYQQPLLRHYDPGIPLTLFEHLLLPKRTQMEQLYRIEQYLTARKRAAASGYPSIFRYSSSTRSFAIQYFEQSSYHQELRQRIEAYAHDKQSKRKSKLVKELKRYQDLTQRSNALNCQCVSRGRRSCEKCELRSSAAALEIYVHEWPLPENDLQAKAVVFELDIPADVGIWRDTTYSLLVDILYLGQNSDPAKGSETPTYTLYKYPGLSQFVGSQATRLQLASTAKSFEFKSHYRRIRISQANESNVCVKHGLIYAMYDSQTRTWTQDLRDSGVLREKCTPKLPTGPYAGLQYAVDSTAHSSNEVIARQGSIPPSMTTHEYFAFGSLRSGYRLQWRNIVRELIARVLNFNSQETNLLVTQAAWQTGPFSEKVSRESHVDLEEKEFGKSLLSVLSDAFDAIESNWQNTTAARTFIALTTRLFSLCTCDEIREGCARVLRRIRGVMLRWIRELGQKLQSEQKEEELQQLNARTLEAALICYETFDVDLHYINHLITSDEDIADITECLIITDNRCPVVTEKLPSSIQNILLRQKRLSHRIETTLRKKISESRHGLDSTIGRFWRGYEPGSPWTALESPNERWLVAKTSAKDNSPPMQVHFNLLNGNLLVNGQSLSRLPKSYESHPTFCRLFGEVMRSLIELVYTRG